MDTYPYRAVWCLLLFFVGPVGSLFANGPVVLLEDKTQEVNLARFAQTLAIDTQEAEQFMTILDRKETAFTPNPGDSFVVPYCADSLWIRFTVRTDSLSATGVTWWYVRAQGSPASFDVYFPHVDGSYRKTAASAPADIAVVRELERHRSLAIPVHPDVDRSVYYIHAVPGVSRSLSFTLESPQGFRLNTKLRSTVEGSLMGIAVFMIVYSLILYRYTRDSQRLWFSAVVACLLLTEISVAGVGVDVFGAGFSRLFVIPLSIVSVLFVFTRYFIAQDSSALSTEGARWWFVGAGLVGAGAIVLLLVAPIALSSAVVMALVLLVSVAIWAVALKRTFPGDPQSKFFLVSWTPALAVVSAVAVQSLGIAFPWYINTYTVFVAMTIGIVLTSMTTGYLYAITEAARNKAIQKQIALEQSNAKLQNFAASARAMAAENERDRIAREIHDTVGYALTTILAQIDAVSHIYGSRDDEISSRLKRIDRMIRISTREVRAAVHELREPSGDQDTVGRIRELCAAFTDSTGALAALTTDGTLDGLNNDVGNPLFHTVQEGLTNAWRHGNAQRIRIRLSAHKRAGRAVVAIRDFGGGAQEVSEGTGLAGIRERVEAVGGSLRRYAAPGRGFLLLASVPIHERNDHE